MRRRYPRKPLIAYILPLILSVAVIILVTLLVNLLIGFQKFKEEQALTAPIGRFNVETDNVYMVLSGKPTKLYQGYNNVTLKNEEGIKTGGNAKVFVQLSGEDYLRLDEQTTIFAKRPEQGNVKIGVDTGNIWLRTFENAERENVTIKTEQYTIVPKVPSTIALNATLKNETVSVLEGDVQVEVYNETNTLSQSLKVGVGQSLTVDRTGKTEGLQAISDEMKASDWFEWNMKEDAQLLKLEATGVVPATDDEEVIADEMEEEEDVTLEDAEVTIDTLRDGDEVRVDEITVGGTFSGTISAIMVNGKEATLHASKNTWSIAKVELLNEGKNAVKLTYETTTGEKGNQTLTVVRDTTAPDAPVLSPDFPDVLTEEPTKLTGTVSSDVVRVVINGYTLRLFKPGDTTWSYNLGISYDTLKEGENEYEVVVYDEAGNPSDPLLVKVDYEPSEEAIETGTGSTLE